MCKISYRLEGPFEVMPHLVRDYKAILRVADVYDVKVEAWDDVKDGDFQEGPAGHGLSLDERAIYLDWFGFERGFYDVAVVLHELMHVVCCHPKKAVTSEDEEDLLLQVERSIARAALSRSAYKEVVTFQEVTAVCPPELSHDEELAQIPNYHCRPWWRAGFARARRLGILNEHNYPTWKMPDWSKDVPV